jgi:hypothetical protein
MTFSDVSGDIADRHRGSARVARLRPPRSLDIANGHELPVAFLVELEDHSERID